MPSVVWRDTQDSSPPPKICSDCSPFGWIGGRAGGGTWLGSDVVQKFLSETGDGQALGWQIPAYAPAEAFGHSGFTGTFVLGVPSSRLGIVLLTNRQHLGVDHETSYPDIAPLQREVTEALTRGR